MCWGSSLLLLPRLLTGVSVVEVTPSFLHSILHHSKTQTLTWSQVPTHIYTNNMCDRLIWLTCVCLHVCRNVCMRTFMYLNIWISLWTGPDSNDDKLLETCCFVSTVPLNSLIPVCTTQIYNNLWTIYRDAYWIVRQGNIHTPSLYKYTPRVSPPIRTATESSWFTETPQPNITAFVNCVDSVHSNSALSLDL